VLSVDETVRNPKSGDGGPPQQGRPGGMGMGGGKKISAALGGGGMAGMVGKGRGVRAYQGRGGK